MEKQWTQSIEQATNSNALLNLSDRLGQNPAVLDFVEAVQLPLGYCTNQVFDPSKIGFDNITIIFLGFASSTKSFPSLTSNLYTVFCNSEQLSLYILFHFVVFNFLILFFFF